MKKIAIITAGFAPVPAIEGGAVERLTTYLIDANEKKKSYQFDLYTIADIQLNKFKYANTNIIQVPVRNWERIIEKIINKIAQMAGSKKRISMYYHRLLKALKKCNKLYDIVIFENVMEIFADVDRILHSRNYILHLHNDLNHVSKSIPMASAMNNAGVKLMAVSKFIRNRLVDQVGYDGGNSFVLYNCVDYGISNKYGTLSQSDEKKKFGYSENDYLLLFVGRLNEEKGILELAKAFAEINNPDIKLMVCGGTWGTDFKDNQFSRKIYDALGERKRDVFFAGYVPPDMLICCYKAADAVVIPSTCQEAFGMVMLEAALCGKPIIATKSGGMPEILSEECAQFVDLDDRLCIKLIEKINWCILHKSEARQMGERAQESILKNRNFDQTMYYDNFKSILDHAFK